MLRRRIERLQRRSAEAIQRFRTAGQRRGAILIYHRVAEPVADPWGMAVSPANFAEHLQVLRRHGVPRTASDFSRHLDQGEGTDSSVVVTFDDGYLDNLSEALPLLEAADVPATVYVIADAIGDPAAFWWDCLAQTLLAARRLPGSPCPLPPAAPERDRLLGEEVECNGEELARLRAWSADNEQPSSRRQRLFLAVWAHLASLEPAERRVALAEFCAWAGVPVTTPDCRPMTPPELHRLAASPLIEIGGHTATHTDLSAVDEIRANAEIRDGRESLSQLTGQAVNSFAYPFGRFAPGTPALLQDAGYLNATCSRFGIATTQSNRYLLPRLHVRDCSGAELDRTLASMLGRRRSAAPTEDLIRS